MWRENKDQSWSGVKFYCLLSVITMIIFKVSVITVISQALHIIKPTGLLSPSPSPVQGLQPLLGSDSDIETGIHPCYPGLPLQGEATEAHVGVERINTGVHPLGHPTSDGVLSAEDVVPAGAGVRHVQPAQYGEGGAHPETVAGVLRFVRSAHVP